MHTPPLPDPAPSLSQPLRFVRRGEIVTLHDVPPDRTLLEVLREDLQCSGTKEGCGEGDCGACTVVVGEAAGTGGLRLRAINSCIRLAHSVNGLALWTIEDIGADNYLHPAQQAMVQCHGSQCGFCTPGFVMSLFALYHSHVGTAQHPATPIDRAQAQTALSGNLCRCTGYRPILEAAQTMLRLPPVPVDEAGLLSKLELLVHDPCALQADWACKATYMAPTRLAQLLALRAQHPQAQLVAGCTDVGLWITKLHRQFAQVLDLTRVAELQCVEQHPEHTRIGAAVTLSDAFAALVAQRPRLQAFTERFAGLPVRNSGTLGGNVANGSPIGDSMPLLIALNARVLLVSVRGQRELPLQALYTGYRQNVMAADEVLAWIDVPRPQPNEHVFAYKVSKRFEDDISAVCLAIRLQLQDGVVHSASLGAGGVAATPVRAHQTEAALAGQPWTRASVDTAMQTLRGEFTPISDMRASADYRRQVLGQLLLRCWLESQGVPHIDLHALRLLERDAP